MMKTHATPGRVSSFIFPIGRVIFVLNPALKLIKLTA
jgi:hypothetical protein